MDLLSLVECLSARLRDDVVPSHIRLRQRLTEWYIMLFFTQKVAWPRKIFACLLQQFGLTSLQASSKRANIGGGCSCGGVHASDECLQRGIALVGSRGRPVRVAACWVHAMRIRITPDPKINELCTFKSNMPEYCRTRCRIAACQTMC